MIYDNNKWMFFVDLNPYLNEVQLTKKVVKN